MLRGKRIACLLSTSLLFTYPNMQTPFLPMATEVVKNSNDKEMVQDFRLKKLQIQFEKDREEIEKNKKQQININKDNEENEPKWQEFIVSFYTGLDEENSKYGAVNCRKLPLERGMVANNILPYGTQIYLDNDYGIRTVEDTGSKIFNSSNRIDLYVARWDGETKEQWKRRAESYGIKKIQGYIIKTN